MKIWRFSRNFSKPSQEKSLQNEATNFDKLKICEEITWNHKANLCYIWTPLGTSVFRAEMVVKKANTQHSSDEIFVKSLTKSCKTLKNIGDIGAFCTQILVKIQNFWKLQVFVYKKQRLYRRYFLCTKNWKVKNWFVYKK